MAIEDTTSVVHISTNITMGCKLCDHVIGGEYFADSINHYLTEHGYRLLHVGIETIPGPKGEPWHTTVAVLGEQS